MNIFPIFYFGPISYFSALIATETYQFETFENFKKQTYRNRCYVMGANGKLRLAIPISHNGSRHFKDIQPSYEVDWQKEHLKSLQSAYKSSPYFEYYEDDLLPLFQKKEKFLIDINWQTIEFVQQKLKFNLDKNLTDSYKKYPLHQDFREKFDSKQEDSEIIYEPYYQVFDEKSGFLPNLSILDLMFNEGPAAMNYLKNVSNKGFG